MKKKKNKFWVNYIFCDMNFMLKKILFVLFILF